MSTFSLRFLLRQRGYVALSVLTLALAIGANVVVFSIVNALWLRPRPVTEPERVVVISKVGPGGFQTDMLRPSEIDAVRSSSMLADVAGQQTTRGVLGDLKPRLRFHDGGSVIEPLAVTANYFDVLGVTLSGRAFAPADDTVGAPATAVISDRLWRRDFDGAPVVGTTVPTSYEPVTIIGIAPPGFHGARLGEQVDVWIPVLTARRFTPLVRAGVLESVPADAFINLLGLGRLTPGVTIDATTRALGDVDADLLVFPLSKVLAAPGQVTTSIREGRFLGVVGATSTLVLIAGCATLAALVMVHYERRRRELAMRLALGSGRARLAGHLIAELAVIAVLGVAAALFLARTLLDAVRTLSLPAGVTLDRLDLVLDWRVMLAGVSGAVLTLVAAGLLPVARFTRPATVGQLTSSATAPPSSLRLRRFLLASHAAATVLVLVGAALFVRTVAYGFGIGAGFDVDRTVFMILQPSMTQFPTATAVPDGEDAARRSAALRDLLEDLEALPDVERATSGRPPIAGPNEDWGSRTATADDGQRVEVAGRTVGSDYLDVLGIPLLAGTFAGVQTPGTGADGQGSPGDAIVVTRFMAAALWPDALPLGREITIGSRRYQVTGVVEDFVQESIRSGTRAGYLMPTSSPRYGDQLGVVRFAMRTRGPAAAALPAIQALADQGFPEAAQLDVVTGTELLERDLGRERLGAAFFSGYGVVSLVLGLAGVFGIVAYLAESRRKELGIRAALGATPRHLARQAVSTGLVPVASGTAVGLVAGVLMSRLVDGFLFGVTRLDPVSFGGAAGLMLLGAATAGFVAAWRVRRLTPMDALRE